MPEQQALDCYQRNLEDGLAAKNSGDCRQALRYFRDAQSCPDVFKMPNRAEEIEKLIAQCSDTKAAAAETPARSAPSQATPAPARLLADDPTASVRRTFHPSREFLKFDKPECFDITCREAARAFAGGYWDDAAALYRAAKNCADADQADRLEANRRISACKAASQDELRKKEQEAIRQARHALAANRANDAERLLRNFDRSLAYRVADFANEYIAPEDNDACQQAMFNAVYYSPSVHSGLASDYTEIPFCYELGDNLDNQLFVRFLGSGRNSKICALAPTRDLLFRWDVKSFEPETPIRLEDTTLTYMDAVSDGRTLFFVAQDAYLFWRSPREVFRLPVPKLSWHFCFSADGRSFFYLNEQEMQVYALDLSDAFATRKGFTQRAVPEPTGIYADYGIRRIAGGNGQFWIGYADSIVVYTPQRSAGKQWGRAQTFRMEKDQNDFPPGLWLDPQARAAVLTNDTSSIYFEIPESDTAIVYPTVQLAGQTLTVGANSRRIATYRASMGDSDGRLYIYTPGKNAYTHAALIPLERNDSYLSSSAFSPDNSLLATTYGSGKLVVWMLTAGNNLELRGLGPNKFIVPVADGSAFFAWREDSLLRVPAEQPGQALYYTPAPAGIFPTLVVEQNWVAYRKNMATVVLTDQLGLERFTVSSPSGISREIVGDFRADEQQFVYLTGRDSVAVLNLNTGVSEAIRGFGGPVHHINYVPGAGEVLIVHELNAASWGGSQQVVKLWNPAAPPETALRTLRLQQYETREVTFSENQGFIAFTDGIDIRVFQQNDLLDEAIRIRQNGTHMVTALQFHPDGTMLAAGYEDGSIIFWDLKTGQARFQWAKLPVRDSDQPTDILRLRFADNGRRLHIYLLGNRWLVKDLAVSLIRSGVQSNFRKLIAFKPKHIREFNLEQALDYPNNFARLARSGDFPLIRSFFDYFQETVQYSNNVQRVGDACTRANILFGQLDASTQNILRPALLAMFENYHWKLLLRNQVADAQKTAEAMTRDFGNPVVAVLAAAHTALLRGDKRRAAGSYAEWAFRRADANAGLLEPGTLDSLHQNIQQLLEYDLIRPDQLDCLCALFGSFEPFDQRCKTLNFPPLNTLLDTRTAQRWQIFQQLNTAQRVKSHQQRVQLLEKTYAEVGQLQRYDLALYQRTLESIRLALGKAYTDWGLFELQSDLAQTYLQRAVSYLNIKGVFQNPVHERQRLYDLATYHLFTGNYYLNEGALPEAANSYSQGLAVANELLQNVESDRVLSQKYRDWLISNLHVQQGLVLLQQGRPDAAQEAFEQAQNESTEGIHRLYFGHVALLRGNKVEAFQEYHNIQNDSELGNTLFEIEQMAKRQPDQCRRLLESLYQLRHARLITNAAIDSSAADYQWFLLKLYTFGAQAQWDSAYHWSTAASNLAWQQLVSEKTSAAVWQNRWLDAQLNQVYYLLFCSNRGPARLNEAIRLSQDMENYCATNPEFTYYEYQSYIKTNMAHAYWLRNQPGDRAQALALYTEFLKTELNDFDPWEVLQKDFRDLKQAGVVISDYEELVRQIN